MFNVVTKQTFGLLRTYLRPEWLRVGLLGALLVLSVGLNLLEPQILRDFIDLTTDEITKTRWGGMTSTIGIGLFFLVITLLHHLLIIARDHMIRDVRWRTTNALRSDLARHCLRLDMAFHNLRTPGEMISRVDGDVNALSDFFAQFIVGIIGRGIFILGVLWMLFREDWRLGLWFTVIVLITGHLLGKVFRLAVVRFQKSLAIRSDLLGFIEERLAGTADIRANGAVPYTMRCFHEIVKQQYEIEYQTSIAVRLTYSIVPSVFSVGTALALGLGGYLYQTGSITLGTVYLIVSYSSMMQWPLRELTQRLQDLQKAVAGASRIQALFQTKSAIQAPPSAETVAISSEPLPIAFKQVSFHYAEDNPVLQDLSFKVQSGQVLGILGRTGSGKTTITRLLFRLYEATRGQILLGDQAVEQWPLDQLRQQVGMVTQEVQLFQASVRNNLTFFNPHISDDCILAALNDLGLASWLASLPSGLDTQLAADGSGLSAGEAQLLAFARIFLQNPSLVILDEASSRLDPATEGLIERAIDKLLRNRTAIIIAHRLATVQRADAILILEQGQILEYGVRTKLAANPASAFNQLLATGLEVMPQSYPLVRTT